MDFQVEPQASGKLEPLTA